MGLEGEIPTSPTSCDPGGSGNNKAAPPPKPRDPRYYIEDGNMIFLVDGILFKLHRSFLTSQMDESSYLSDLIKTQTSSDREKGTSENNPIEIPIVKASQFRSLLFVLLGTPANAEYLSLLTEANQVDSNMQSRFTYYLDISLLAMTFGMNDLGIWAHCQLKVLLQSSGSLASKAWKEDTLLQALRCAYIMPGDTVDFEHDMLAFLYLVLSPSTSSLQDSQSGFNLETCVGLFKRVGLLESAPQLFGYIFAIILSLGHQSPVWKENLTREDRAALYAAQVHLVRLGRYEGLSLRWLTLSQNLRPAVSFLAMDCHSCIKNL
ncbi:hypothetical protein FRC12_020106 [Ceratobasidium sp. 428]|nr:hypothetical protein FRC12_020106 [Ceratobasidium sp. 428]